MLFGKPVVYSRDYSFEFPRSIGKISYRFQVILLYWKVVLKKIIFSFFFLLISLVLYTISSLDVPGYLPTESEFFFLTNHTYSQWLAPSSSKLAYQVYLPNHFTLLISSSRNFCFASLCSPLKSNLSLLLRGQSSALWAHLPLSRSCNFLLAWSVLWHCLSYHLCSHLRNACVLA